MARFFINTSAPYYKDFGTGGEHWKTEWLCAKDIFFNKVIDRCTTEELTGITNILQWTTPLPKIEEDKVDPNVEEFYYDLEEFYLRLTIYVGESKSNTIVAGPFNQKDQKVDVYKNGKKVITTTSKELGWMGDDVVEMEDWII